ncbi:cobyrinate a,c-diamide synthase [Chromobacterium piscinae]|uniref:Cobyrinate a,c-diamide synthase n=1 Tax=Chromobacterium piscinae TaxID=686831 RepID=A0ABV0H918_9NEIS
MTPRSCPALFLTAPASHQGKTTVTAALARHHRNLGRRVRVFKTGPDFLDPYILERASGHTVYGLDLWMNGEDDCRARLHQAAGDADLILVEGSMGLFDGTPSSADLATLLGIPLAAVIDAAGMAQTFAAVAHGLASFRPGLAFHGFIANHVASERHADMLAQQLPPHPPLLAALRRDEAARLPERHLGLVQAQEIADLDARLDRAASQIAATALAESPPPVAFPAAKQTEWPQLLAGKRIAIARDAAFAFVYPANLEMLAQLGAELAFFSPLADAALPDCDAVYLPGGYPELHLETLSANSALKADLQEHIEAGKPLYAECGGMLYLLDRLSNRDGDSASMLGLLPGQAVLQDRLCGLGLQQMDFPGGALRGHTFHYTRLETALEPIARAARASGAGSGEALYRRGSLLASYFHAYFPSNPIAAARLFLK